MLATDNSDIGRAAPADPADITIGELLGMLAIHREKPLLFSCGGRTIRAGYHVTEVKAGRFAALDCGANPEAWTEIFVQLWDIDGEQPHMAAGKFAAIIGKVARQVNLAPSARLTFEVSDGIRPIELYRAMAPTVADGAVRVELDPRPASCKPRDRWLKDQRAAEMCRGEAENALACCGASADRGAQSIKSLRHPQEPKSNCRANSFRVPGDK